MTESAKKAKPILFSSAMVRAILDGTKTQTRRVIKPQPYIDGELNGTPMWFWESKRLEAGYCHTSLDAMERMLLRGCPYQVGDVLWVREAWQPARNGDTGEVIAIYRSDWEGNGRPEGPGGGKWRPSIHMPRWASRIKLRVTSVRAERLNDISEADAIAEGIDDAWLVREHVSADSRIACFRQLWESINGKGSWASNAWVFAYTFQVEARPMDSAAKDG